MLIAQNPKPRAILGLMTIGPDSQRSQGYNEVDTARVYVGGQQEAFTREARWKERGLTLATKWYPFEAGQHRPEVVIENCNKSLEELGTKCVDIYYLHGPDRSVPFAETLKAVDQLHKEGKFVQFGLSNYTAFEVAEIVMTCKANGWVRPTIYQGMYNCLTRSIETELITAAHRYGLDIVVYNPIAGGLMSGKLKLDEIPKEGRFSDAHGFAGQLYRQRYFKDATFDALRLIEPVVKQHGLTLIETAFRWLRHHSKLNMNDGGRDGIILGISSKAQLESNLQDIEKGPLPEEVVKVLDEGWNLCKPTTANYWHKDLEYTYDTQKALFE